MNKTYSVEEAKVKLESYCTYQERCSNEVVQKLQSMNIITQRIDFILGYLIENNFLNEERFACSFARGKHRIKHWGKIRIANELKYRNISESNINRALKEITIDEYLDTLHKLTVSYWNTIRETNTQKKRKKFCDYFLRKGFESGLIYQRLIDLEND